MTLAEEKDPDIDEDLQTLNNNSMVTIVDVKENKNNKKPAVENMDGSENRSEKILKICNEVSENYPFNLLNYKMLQSLTNDI